MLSSPNNHSNKHSLETQLIILCSHIVLLPSGVERLEDIIGAVRDWEWLVDKSNRHRVSPLIYHHLTHNIENLQEYVPEPCLEKLKQAYLFSLMVNSRLMKSLETLLESYSSADIPVIILKGPALCLSIYPDLALRPFSDLDILISREHLQKAKSLMPDMGYSIIYGSYRNPDNLNEELGCEWSYIKDAAVVEVHWNLLDKLAPYQIDIHRFWEGAIEKKIDGQQVLIFSPENQLLHLCLHQYKHHWQNLRELVDITGMVEAYEGKMDWEQVIEQASHHGISRCVYYSLHLSRKILRAPVPEQVMTALSQVAGVGFLGSRLIKIVEDNILADHIPRRLWKLFLVNTNHDRLMVLREIVIRPFARKHDNGPAMEIKGSKLRKLNTLLDSLRTNRRFFFDSFKRLFKR